MKSSHRSPLSQPPGSTRALACCFRCPRRNFLFLLFLLLSILSLKAQDTVLRNEGPPLSGKILGSDANGLQVQVIVVPGQPPATMSLRVAQIKEVTFGDAPALQTMLKNATIANFAQVAQLWQQRAALLTVKGSLAPEIGLAYAKLLVTTSAPNTPNAKQNALQLFEKLLTDAPSPEIKTQAAEGRLLALVALGRASEAVEDAKKLAASSENPAILIRAKFILAEVSFQELRKLVEEHPKWAEDVNIRPKRNQLYHDTLDLYLFPSLFYGAETEPAARGLWSAIQVCKLGDELPAAREFARDIEVLYPTSTYVAQARAFVQTLPPEIQKQDYEKQKD